MPEYPSNHEEEETPDLPLLRKSRAYASAFEDYIRHGEPIRMQEVKARSRGESEGPSTTQYIWRTQGDGKVRASHRANDGKIFSWDDRPPTGHPGEDFGCRCWAEAYFPEVREFARQTLSSAAGDVPRKLAWNDIDFGLHYWLGGGASVTLSQTGNLQGIIDFYSKNLGAYERVNSQIADAAREAGSGSFQYDFGRSYDFHSYLIVLGNSTVNGLFDGTAAQVNNALEISGTVTYEFSDTITDPGSIRESELGTSDPSQITDENIGSEFFGTFYSIEDSWTTSFEARVHVDRGRSRYFA